MSNSYRIRTKPGVDSSIRVLIDQEFEYLEILSLKILQDQIYNRQCSDYGVIVGRVSVNNGFGIPNAKVSVFIPLEDVDQNNAVISDLYPYQTLTDLNEDGYRYNLLPYKQQHGGHTATGTFFTRQDVLTNPTLIEVYDKYYKYNAVTNDSGDYMIFGVPVGSQTIVVDIDLSDIGEFSLSPQDLIRLGIATENQVAGTQFKSSTNLRELPQIITFNRTIEVEPLWGQPDICNLGITRTDFDLSAEANINITPTAVFMGSLISSNDDTFLKKNCKAKPSSGDLCKLTTGPGEILAIRHTIEQDINGRPILEEFSLEQGGQVIDENGTWMIDVPMNLEYVTTNEFGEKVISSDPKVGIPTKGNYRFKVKWNQSPSLAADPIKRGYYLVPNIKEYGWGETDGSGDYLDPLIDTMSNPNDTVIAKQSYAFSLDWNDYGDNTMIQEAINCEDRFFQMSYNKVYTISQLISQYRKGYGSSKIISIKNILDSECESDNNKFPTNDAVFKFDIIYILFQLILVISYPTLISLLLVTHVLAFLILLITPILILITAVVYLVLMVLCPIINGIISAVNWLGGNLNKIDCPDFKDLAETIKKVANLYKLFTTIQLPSLSYPDCEFCSCSDGVPTASADEVVEENDLGTLYEDAEESGANSNLSTYQLYSSYVENNPTYQTPGNFYENIYGGEGVGVSGSTSNPLVPQSRAPQIQYIQTGATTESIFTTSLPIYERLNLFNNKSKYFNNSPTNPGGGVNRIKVSFNYNDGVYHYDNVLAILAKPGTSSIFQAGNILTFQAPVLSKDVNLTGYTTLNQYGTASITGNTINNSGGTITVNYADFSNPNNLLTQTYTSQQDPNDSVYARFPMDIEYFQVVTASTYSAFNLLCSSTPQANSLNERFLKNTMLVYKFTRTTNSASPVPSQYYFNYSQQNQFPTPISAYTQNNDQIVVFLVRGVDPNTTRSECEFDLSLLYGYSSFGNPTTIIKSGVNGAPKYKLNHPVKPGFKNTQHNLTNNTDTDGYSGGDLYYDSYHFDPAQSGLASFSAFTSNLTSYYSSLDGNNMSFKPSLSSPIMNVGFSNTPNGVKVGSSNAYSFEYSNITGNTYTYNTGANNRGYFQNEIVEGGSGLYLTLPSFPPLGVSSDPLFTGPFNSLYYAPSYPTSTNMNFGLGSSGNQIVMRSDRLPTSTTTQINLLNSFPLHTNLTFSVFTIGEDGTSVAYTGTSTPSSFTLTGTSQDNQDNTDEPAIVQNVFDTFNCGTMVPLGCYDEGPNNTLVVAPQGDNCYKNPVICGGKPKMINGCYSFVSFIFLSLPCDIINLTEWASRLAVTFGACRNVFGHMFTNNWINGTLYAFSFRNDVVYSSPTAPNPNQVQDIKYCKDVVTLHPTNNFYYRSSPYVETSSIFVGKKSPIGFFGSYNGNEYSLQFPTTMLDLGPRAAYLQEIILSDAFDGYVSNKLNSTTYSDVSEILNLFIVTRLANTNFLTQLIGGGSVLTYFSRPNTMVDSDYAQSISVNSELGVAPFESANYAAPDQIYVSSLSGDDPLFGIFFTSDTQVRDYITPKRTILSPSVSITNSCAFNTFGCFTQKVPMYQWQTTPGSPSIFGSQKNEWYTTGINGNAFFAHEYQSLDRILASSRYFRTTNANQNDYFKGYIYSVDGSGNLSANSTTKSPNNFVPDAITVGAPFHFYFGLKKGKTAYDRFLSKWVDTNTIVA